MTQPGTFALLKRHPSLTRQDFNSHWLYQHAALAIPWALANGCVSYIQMHNIRPLPWAKEPGNCPADLDLSEYDGAAVMLFDPLSSKSPAGSGEEAEAAKKKSDDYFARMIAPDEKTFLSGPARDIARMVDARLVDGDMIILIEDGEVKLEGEGGRPVVDLTEAFKVWEQWEVGKQGMNK